MELWRNTYEWTRTFAFCGTTAKKVMKRDENRNVEYGESRHGKCLECITTWVGD